MESSSPSAWHAGPFVQDSNRQKSRYTVPFLEVSLITDHANQVLKIMALKLAAQVSRSLVFQLQYPELFVCQGPSPMITLILQRS